MVAKGGNKVKEALQTAAAPTDDSRPGSPRGKDGLLRTPHGELGIQATANGRMRMRGNAVTMARLSEALGMVVGRPVVDKTGLAGTYDVTLDFSPEGMGPGPKGPAPGEGGGNPARADRGCVRSGETACMIPVNGSPQRTGTRCSCTDPTARPGNGPTPGRTR